MAHVHSTQTTQQDLHQTKTLQLRPLFKSKTQQQSTQTTQKNLTQMAQQQSTQTKTIKYTSASQCSAQMAHQHSTQNAQLIQTQIIQGKPTYTIQSAEINSNCPLKPETQTVQQHSIHLKTTQKASTPFSSSTQIT